MCRSEGSTDLFSSCKDLQCHGTLVFQSQDKGADQYHEFRPSLFVLNKQLHASWMAIKLHLLQGRTKLPIRVFTVVLI